MIRLRKGKGLMKYFKIKNNQVYFLNQENKEIALDQITKEDLLFLINKAFDEDFEFDKYDSDKIKNQAHNLIYKNTTSCDYHVNPVDSRNSFFYNINKE